MENGNDFRPHFFPKTKIVGFIFQKNLFLNLNFILNF